VVLESLACGTPVLATGLWGVPEILVSPELGIMVKQEVEDIAQGLDKALSRTWDRAVILGYARTRTWDVVAEEVDQYLTQVTKSAAITH
jgi:glycosyltransferase involved in cell wall biosynthesis